MFISCNFRQVFARIFPSYLFIIEILVLIEWPGGGASAMSMFGRGLAATLAKLVSQNLRERKCTRGCVVVVI